MGVSRLRGAGTHFVQEEQNLQPAAAVHKVIPEKSYLDFWIPVKHCARSPSSSASEENLPPR